MVISGDRVTVPEVLEAFLDWLAARVGDGTNRQRTHDWYEVYIQDFARYVHANEWRIADMAVEELEPRHVHAWADSHPGWTTGKNGAIRAIQRAFNWAAKNARSLLRGTNGVSPIAGTEKPQPGRRELLISEEEYRETIAHVRDPQFRDLLELAWETGARPQELFSVTGAMADIDADTWTFPVKLSKGKRKQRVVYLSKRAAEITLRLKVAHPEGPLLLNTDGKSWCCSSVKNRFQRLARAIGRERMVKSGSMPPKVKRVRGGDRAEHRKKVLARRKTIAAEARKVGLRQNLYAFRHSLITELLVAGADAVTVSILAGHESIAMIAKHYAHLQAKRDHMRAAANRVRGTG
jgi:integrase